MAAADCGTRRPIRVLFIHHYGVFTGSSRSLWELIGGFSPGSVDACVLTPPGKVVDVFERTSIRCVTWRGVSLFDNTRYGHYRGLRWLILLREIVRVPSTVATMWRMRKASSEFDLVHVNEIVLLLPIVLASRWIRRPVIVHVRAVQQVQASWGGRLVSTVLNRYAAHIVAIDETVRRSLPRELTVPVSVIHNGFATQAAITTVVEKTPSQELVVAMVGNLLLVKGCLEFVRAAAICKSQKLPVRFVFVGARGNTSYGWRSRLVRWLGLWQDIEQELRDLVTRLQLTDVVEFRLFTTDLEAVYKSVDVVCFPSHLDAPGRPIFEAAFFGVPSIAAISEPTPDTFVDGDTGLKIRPGAPDEISRAVRYLLENPDIRSKLGRNARELAVRQFDPRRNALAVLEVYKNLLS